MKKSLLMLLSLAVVGSNIASACPCGNKPRPRDGEIKTEREDKKPKPGCNCGR